MPKPMSSEEILALEKSLLQLENLHASFDYLRISIASPKKIKSWAQRITPSGEIIGEVLSPETLNFRTYEPECYGLFCQKIFGPIKNWSCACGKYKGVASEKICDSCEVELIEARVRRYRMGYIDLICPIAHYWYLKGKPNYLILLLRMFNRDLKLSDLEKIVYFTDEPHQITFERITLDNLLHIDGEEYSLLENELEEFTESSTISELESDTSEIEPDFSELEPDFSKLEKFFSISKLPYISEENRMSLLEKFGNTYDDSDDYSQIKKGAEIIRDVLDRINIPCEIDETRAFLENAIKKKDSNERPFYTIKECARRARVLESFLATRTNPAWMILTTLPVLPPGLRPLFELESGRLIAADINEIYRLILTRNQRLFEFSYNLLAPMVITIQAKKLLQESVDCLIDNARLAKSKIFFLNNKPLKSLTEILEGKQGRFRHSLLGKRVDYSGRSVIIVGPNLRLNECGLPYEIAVELFQPFLINELLKTKIKSNNMKLASTIIRKNKPFIWALLNKLTKHYSILLNRAPTLHRFGIQAFDPIIVLGQAIHLHPLVCTGFNADFDGDQMAVHLPLYESSQLEVQSMMKPSYNILSPSNGEVILKPTQDIVIGCYYLTLMTKLSQVKTVFANEENALFAFSQKKITIHSPILVRYSLPNFQIRLENNELILYDNLLHLAGKKIIIYKKFEIGNVTKKYYFLTNIGIFIARYACFTNYKISDLLLQTTPGRLIFTINLRNLLSKKE